MNKSDLLSEVHEITGVSKPDIEAVISAIEKAVYDRLSKSDDSETVPFGKTGRFEVSVTKERDGRNPKSGEKIRIAAKRKLVFVVNPSRKYFPQG